MMSVQDLLRGTVRARPTAAPLESGTIVAALAANAAAFPARPAMRHRSPDGSWRTITWAGYHEAVGEVSRGLARLGVAAGDRVAILSSNRPEWHLADLGTLACGAVSVPVYPTSSTRQVAYVLGHSAASVCFVDDHDQLGKVLAVLPDLPGLQRVVLMAHDRRASDTMVMGFDELRSSGEKVKGVGSAVEFPSPPSPGDLATIVYTSGTTGPPKGAMISHDNLMWTVRHVAPVYGMGPGERLLSFLPLSHIAERMMSDFLPIAVCGETWFARSLSAVGEDLPACRPTTFLAVPRAWEKLREGVIERIESLPVPVRLAFRSYVSLGLRMTELRQRGEQPGAAVSAAYRSLDRSLGATVRRQLGLDQARIVVSAAAPAHPDLLRWFHAIGLPLIQIYGQTEDCGPTSGNRPDRNRIGTVGRAFPGVEVRIAEDGEILVRGGNVCRGYLDDPKATAELIDADGWMHSGDCGYLDDEGELRLTGRKKDLIITASGKNVAPQDIEADLRNQPLVSEAVVVGEGRRFLTALLTLDSEEVGRWAGQHHKLDGLEALSQDPDLLRELQRSVDEVNERRSRAEAIRKFKVLPSELTMAAGELTPTMKVKREVVYEHQAPAIEELYAGS